MEQLRNAFLKARYDLNFSSPLELRIALHPRGVMPPWMARKGLALCAPGFYSFRPRNGSGFVPGRFHTNMTVYDQLQTDLRHTPRLWLVTGVAGFIGSHLLETLLRLNQRVVGLDNFEAGKRANLDQVRTLVAPAQWAAFRFIEGDIADPAACQAACAGVDVVLHHAALGSVPRSIAEPLASHRANVTGFLQMLLAAREAGVKRFVYASSSAVYGDHPGLPKVEEKVGRVLSPYAATKAMNEVYADVCARAYGIECIGLRYFNVFGPRQDPDGAYAAVIPKWIAAMLRREPVRINGDGETSRDFCYVANVVQANLLAGTTPSEEAINQVYNIAVGERTTLNELFQLLQTGLRQRDASLPEQQPVYQDFRPGDVRHSHADIGKAARRLGYAPTHRIGAGLEVAFDWYRANLG
ncbi:MAG: UDP-glucose 4-epimerase [Verrucomicrobia bacterium ADurb.Bin118]|jgi:UDP-N-acetylglucosamine 4-epimerase|nr:MAG: UDP-glucose 4-epimerase [Verrucomicrobia bacterium ADurb.Bin118]